MRFHRQASQATVGDYKSTAQKKLTTTQQILIAGDSVSTLFLFYERVDTSLPDLELEVLKLSSTSRS